MLKSIHSAFLLTALIAAPVFAEPAPAQNKVIVRTSDLNLSTALGQRRLDRRLAHAVVDVCGVASTADLAGSNEVRRCRDDTASRLLTDRGRLIAVASRSTSIVIAAR